MTGEYEGSTMRVLVVEDDTDIAGVLRRSLDKEGYDVRVAGDGAAAIDEAGVFEPDAVVLDLGLPRLDGVAVCRRLRDEGKTVLLVEHDMKVVMGLCETVFVLDHGEKLAEGAPGVIQADERVIEAYFGR